MRPVKHYILLISIFTALAGKSQTPVLNSYPSAAATVFINFDGQFITGSAWNFNGDINAAPAGFSSDDIIQIFSRVAEDYRPFNLNITTDSVVYQNAPADKRICIIVTPTSAWYGSAGGVSFTGSFIWGDNTPAWVFSALLGNQPKWVAEAISHEIGHTLGLQHQSVYDVNCNKVAEYNTGLGTGEIGWAPIMGAGYYKNHTTWHIGPNTIDCSTLQNDFDIIQSRNGFSLREDDHGDNNATATEIPVFAGAFSASGLINTATDLDVFKLVLTHSTVLNLNAIPQNVGSGDDGANVDIKVTLLNGNDTINSYNPLTLLNAGVDTNLNAGVYYFAVDGVGNVYHNDVGSIGLYKLTATIASILPVREVSFRGMVNNNRHQLSWSYQTDEAMLRAIIETSADGLHFSTLSTPEPAAKTFSYQPVGNETIFYRLKIILQGNEQVLSAIISLKNKAAAGSNVQVVSGNKENITVISSNNYSYRLFNISGQLLGIGKLIPGVNNISVTDAKGLLLLQCNNAGESFTQKLIKQ